MILFFITRSHQQEGDGLGGLPSVEVPSTLQDAYNFLYLTHFSKFLSDYTDYKTN